MKELIIKKTKKGSTVYLVGDKKVRISKVKFEDTARVRFHRERFRKFQTLSVAGEVVSWKGKSQWNRKELNDALKEEGYLVQNKRIVTL